MKKTISTLALLGLFAAQTHAAPTVQVRLPERFRLLTGQLFDLRIEATGLTNANSAAVQISVDGVDVTASLPAPEVTTNNDSNASDLDKPGLIAPTISRPKA